MEWIKSLINALSSWDIPNIYNVVLAVGSTIYVLYKIYSKINVVGLETPIKKQINMFKEFCIWYSCFFVEGMAIANFLPDKNWIIEVCALILLSIYCIFWEVGILAYFFCLSGLKIKRRIWSIYMIIMLILSFSLVALANSMPDVAINNKHIFFLLFSFGDTIMFEFLYVCYMNVNINKKYFYYLNGRKYFLHNITNREVICSYNRNLNCRKGYTVEKIKDIKKHMIFCDNEQSVYAYLIELLKEHKVETINYQEIIDKGSKEEMSEFLNIVFKEEPFQNIKYYWGLALIIKTKRIKWLKKKIDLIKSEKNNRCFLVATERKDVYVLLLVSKNKRRTKKIYTHRLDQYVEKVAANFEYNPYQKLEIY